MLEKVKSAYLLIFLALYFIATNWVVFFFPVDFFSVSKAEPIIMVDTIQSSASKPSQILESQWHAISLPDFWVDNHKDIESLWYRSYFQIDVIEDEIWAIYLPSVSHNAAVYINEHWVGQGGQFEAPLSRHHNEPLLFKFSSSLLNAGENKVDIRVKTVFYTQGLFDKFYIAPVNMLQGSYDWKHFVRVDFIQWLTIFMLVAAVIVVLFWIARPQDTVYGYFALLLFLWALHNFNLFVNHIPISEKLWEAMTMSTLGWTVVVMILFNHRYVGQLNYKIEKILLVFAVLGFGIFLLPNIGSILTIGYGLWDFFLIIFGIYALYFLMHSYLHHNSFDAYLIMLVGVPIITFGLHDILLVNHLIDRREGLTIQFSIIPTVVLFSWFLIRRFLQSINKAEQLAATLERRVEEKQRSLEIQYQQINRFEKQGVLANERERIMRDMHDGIGGQLISIVTLLTEHNESILVTIREKIKHSISDLRFVIDSLDPLLDDLLTLLGTMRMRLADQLSDADIELEWGLTELPELEALTPSKSLHIMRIVQEAVTNSIKHSKSKKLKIATGLIALRNDVNLQNDECIVYVDIIDYGQGKELFSSSITRQNRGLTNMKYRAEQLNAQLEVSFLDSGTTVRLLLKMTKG